MSEENFVLDLEPELIEELKIKAEEHGVSLEEFLSTVLTALLQEEFDKAVAAGQVDEKDMALFATNGGMFNVDVEIKEDE